MPTRLAQAAAEGAGVFEGTELLPVVRSAVRRVGRVAPQRGRFEDKTSGRLVFVEEKGVWAEREEGLGDGGFADSGRPAQDHEAGRRAAGAGGLQERCYGGAGIGCGLCVAAAQVGHIRHGEGAPRSWGSQPTSSLALARSHFLSAPSETP